MRCAKIARNSRCSRSADEVRVVQGINEMCGRSNDSMADARGHLLHASAKETKGKWDSLLCKACYSAQGSVTALGRGVVKRQPYAPLRATTLCAFPIRFDYADLSVAMAHRHGLTGANSRELREHACV